MTKKKDKKIQTYAKKVLLFQKQSGIEYTIKKPYATKGEKKQVKKMTRMTENEEKRYLQHF